MICPRCQASLTREFVEGEYIDACKSCGGMWLHKHQLNNLLKESQGDVEECSVDDNPHEDVYPEVKCRECADVVMKKVNFLEYSDIIMDYCSSCGAFWLDKDELANMQKYIKMVEEGSHEVSEFSAYNLLVRLSKIAYSIFH